MRYWLIVDDQPMIIDGLLTNLVGKFSDVEVLTATSFEEARGRALLYNPELLIVDIELNENQNGFDLIETLRYHGLEFKTIVHSMYDNVDHVRKSFALDVDSFINKGTAGKELIGVINMVLGGRKCFSERMKNIAALPDKIMKKLSNRQREVITFMLAGYSTQEIADKIEVSYDTARTHRRNVLEALDVETSDELTKLLGKKKGS